MNSLSILLVIHNEESQLEDCLKTVSFADEIVVILDKCTDNSEKIVKRFNSKIFKGSWDIEGDRRNFGISKCTSEWILEIDADERVTKSLKKEILETVRTSRFDWHLINVNNFIGKRLVRYGWGAYIGKSSYPGLFRQNIKIWGKQRVHPKLSLSGEKGYTLNNNIDHFYCESVFDLINKLDSYSSSRASDLNEQKKKENLITNIKRIFSRFWKAYILRKGYREKQLGFMIAIIASLFPLISYLKYRIEKND